MTSQKLNLFSKVFGSSTRHHENARKGKEWFYWMPKECLEYRNIANVIDYYLNMNHHYPPTLQNDCQNLSWERNAKDRFEKSQGRIVVLLERFTSHTAPNIALSCKIQHWQTLKKVTRLVRKLIIMTAFFSSRLKFKTPNIIFLNLIYLTESLSLTTNLPRV